MGFFDFLFGKKPQKGVENESVSSASAGFFGNSKFQLSDVYNIKGVGIVVVGKVIDGALVPGQTAQVNGKKTTVKTIEAHHKRLAEAKVGQDIGVALSGVSREDFLPGMIIEFS
ncbi:MAG: hypothetical protein HYW50_02180 [Candidatus Diapherotrites archaeon]|nr:hypothetical protein [Candidatus Diapherotrites archaeon]